MVAADEATGDEINGASASTVADSADLAATLTGLTGGHAVQDTAVTVATVTDGGVDATGSATYQWKLDGGVISGSTDSSYTPTEGDEGHALTVLVTNVAAPGTEVITVSAG